MGERVKHGCMLDTPERNRLVLLVQPPHFSVPISSHGRLNLLNITLPLLRVGFLGSYFGNKSKHGLRLDTKSELILDPVTGRSTEG